jgi:hypothetical protein
MLGNFQRGNDPGIYILFHQHYPHRTTLLWNPGELITRQYPLLEVGNSPSHVVTNLVGL